MIIKRRPRSLTGICSHKQIHVGLKVSLEGEDGVLTPDSDAGK